MAALFREPKDIGNFFIKVRYLRRQFKWGLGHDDETLAQETIGRVERTLRDLREGLLVMPEGSNVVEFLKTAGGRVARLKAPEKPMQLGQLFELYSTELTQGSKAENTLYTNQIHGRRLAEVFGKDCPLTSLAAPGSLQSYVDRRSKQKWRKQPIKARTIKKELATLGTVWRWAVANGRTPIPFPADQVKKLSYPKERLKPRFRTWKEIERKIAQGGLSKADERELWECLFLDLDQVKEVLEHVRTHAGPEWLYPAILFVAHTGARRSEMLRSEREDFEFEHDIIHIREKKKKKGKETSAREVPMSAKLKAVFRDYFDNQHAGGRFSIAINPKEAAKVGASDAEVEAYVGKVVKASWKAFRQVFAGSKWKVLRGYHIFRHSIISNMARESIDQRLIDDIVGHETEAMRQRYRHLFPSDKQDVIRRLYDE